MSNENLFKNPYHFTSTLDYMIKERKSDLKKVSESDYLFPRLSEELDALETVLKTLSKVYEIAFGENAINKDYTCYEVLERLLDFSNKAFYTEQLIEENYEHFEMYKEFLERGY